jgi:hypothetical protein
MTGTAHGMVGDVNGMTGAVSGTIAVANGMKEECSAPDGAAPGWLAV